MTLPSPDGDDQALDEQLTALAERVLHREAQRLRYVLALIREELPALRAAFGTEQSPPRQEATQLFRHTLRALHLVEIQVLTFSTMVHPRGSEALERAAVVQLGWATRDPVPAPGPVGPTGRYVLRPTARGVQLVNGLRAAVGDRSVEDEAAIGREASRRRLDQHRHDLQTRRARG